jgi:hypothetical protein
MGSSAARPQKRKSLTAGVSPDYRLAWPRTIFFILGFFDPRAYVRGFLGACFLRATRLTFLRSSLLSALVFAI